MNERCPQGLEPPGQKVWKQIVSEFDLYHHELFLLQSACEAWDRVAEARALIKRDGAVFLDRYQQWREHPSCVAERQNRTLFARLLRELGLSLEQPEDTRPPRLY
jgi:phage terminase small subunit